MTRSPSGVNRGKVLNVLLNRGAYGATWEELDKELGLGHGTISGALSHMHKTDVVARLREKRSGASVYVLSEDVDDRETVRHGRVYNYPEEVLVDAYERGVREGALQALTDVDQRLLHMEKQLRTTLGVSTMPRVALKNDWVSTPMGTVRVMRAHVANLGRDSDFTASSTRPAE